MARPSKFKPEMVGQAEKLATLGATDREIAEFFDIDERTLNRWKHDNEAFCQALKVGKAQSDARVEQSLYRKALGYSYDAVKIFMPSGAEKPVYATYVEHVPPDTTACIFWLKNRRPEDWRDKVDHEHAGKDGAPIELNVSDRERAKAMAALIAASRKPQA